MTQPIEDQETPDQLLFITELSDFIPLLEDWHQRQVKIIEHLQIVPSGQEVEIEDEPPLILEGDALRGFQLGLSLSLHYLGTLPFNARRDPDETAH